MFKDKQLILIIDKHVLIFTTQLGPFGSMEKCQENPFMGVTDVPVRNRILCHCHVSLTHEKRGFVFQT